MILLIKNKLIKRINFSGHKVSAHLRDLTFFTKYLYYKITTKIFIFKPIS